MSKIAMLSVVILLLFSVPVSAVGLGYTVVEDELFVTGYLTFLDGTYQTSASHWGNNPSGTYFGVSGGSVGIGTSNPIAKLDVTDNTGLESIVQVTGVSANGTRLNLSNTGSSGSWSMITSGTANGGGKLLIQDNNIGGGTVRAAIDTDGYFGIGTANPSSPLTVVAPLPLFPGPLNPVSISGNPGAPGPNSYVNVVINNDYGSSNRKAAISFQSAGTNTWSFGTDMVGNGDQNFYIFDNQAGNARLFIDSSGNVGIGTVVSPAAKLDVNGDIKAQNLPAVKSVQTYRKVNCPYVGTTPQDLDTLTVNAPSGGSLELTATLQGSAVDGATLYYYLWETTNTPAVELVSGFLNGGSTSGVITLHWVLATSAGSRAFKTSVVASSGTSSVCYATSTLTAHFFSAGL
ncbi:MAG: hypothetical protein M0024_10325 [Nitrospiraceae bacterium]|nr:hypothetical protein [Nitrospiraceae bacterium]